MASSVSACWSLSHLCESMLSIPFSVLHPFEAPLHAGYVLSEQEQQMVRVAKWMLWNLSCLNLSW